MLVSGTQRFLACRNMTRQTLNILKSPEVVAINQDPLGVAGDLVWKQGPQEVRSSLIRQWDHSGVLSHSLTDGMTCLHLYAAPRTVYNAVVVTFLCKNAIGT